VDYTIEFARVLYGSSPEAAFAFLSSSGADPTGRSRMSFARHWDRLLVLTQEKLETKKTGKIVVSATMWASEPD
jgi:hypothetical protein